MPDDVRLAEGAAAGKSTDRETVSRLADPIVSHQTRVFCKRFCRDNRFSFACTLFEGWGSGEEDAPLCEWGNASYAWMLEDLTRAERLNRFEGRGGARLFDYLFRIANSLPFYERWKDWRFGRRVRVPTYVQDMGPRAARLFLAMRDGRTPADLAHQLGMSAEEAEALAERIVVELTRRKRLRLLDPPATISLTDLGARRGGDDGRDAQHDVTWDDPPPEHIEATKLLHAGWAKLTVVEQYVLEAMVIEGQDAGTVLGALKRLEIPIKEGLAPADTDRQQLYYFRRKALARLARLAGLAE